MPAAHSSSPARLLTIPLHCARSLWPQAREWICGYELVYHMRLTAAVPTGDFHLIDPADGEKIRSVKRLKEKLAACER